MDELKVCFIGIGSIAKRHIKNLKLICDARKINLIVDAFRRSPNQVDGVDHVFVDENDLSDDYDVIFITNPTNQHLDTLKRFHHKAKHFFIEKPIVSIDQIEQANSFILRKESIYYVAAPLRYNAVIQWIKHNIDVKDIISVRSISSSFLPDWRPDQDYRKTYSAQRKMGGGVSIDLIHEWDYLTYLFGWPKKIYSMIGKKSDLEIDSDDYAIYIAEYLNMIAELHLDYFGRKTIREIELFTKNETILGDIANSKVVMLKKGEIIDLLEERDDYQQRELNYFIDMVEKANCSDDSFHHAVKVLCLTQGQRRD